MQRRFRRRAGRRRNVGARNGIEFFMQHGPPLQAIDIRRIEGDEFLGAELARQAQLHAAQRLHRAAGGFEVALHQRIARLQQQPAGQQRMNDCEAGLGHRAAGKHRTAR